MLSNRTQVICVWSIPAFLIGYIISFVFISGFVPPPAPSLSADEVANLFNDNGTRIRIGQLLCMVFAILYMPWAGVVTVQMARIEGRFPVLAWLQLAGATMLTLLFMLCSLLWLATAFRPLQDPLNTQLLNDLSWLIFVMAYPEYWLQLLAMGIVFLRDKRETPFLPRWACYFTFVIAFTGMGGSFAAFFKVGPWAWNGIFGFWVPIVSYLIWLIVMFFLLLKGLKRQSLEAETA